MFTKVLNDGQVVLPASIQRKLGLQSGDRLDIRVEAGRIVLKPRRTRCRKVKILVDPITGLPVLSAGPDAPLFASEEVCEILFSLP
jgi:AbrB family looped-hinge helix DNA binding protein